MPLPHGNSNSNSSTRGLPVRSGVVTLMGFSIVPPKVLQLLSDPETGFVSYDIELYNHNNIDSNSNSDNTTAMERVLLSPPYRRFLSGDRSMSGSGTSNNSSISNSSSSNSSSICKPWIVIYQLPVHNFNQLPNTLSSSSSSSSSSFHHNNNNNDIVRTMNEISSIRTLLLSQWNRSIVTNTNDDTADAVDDNEIVVVLYDPSKDQFVVAVSADETTTKTKTTTDSNDNDNEHQQQYRQWQQQLQQVIVIPTTSEPLQNNSINNNQRQRWTAVRQLHLVAMANLSRIDITITNAIINYSSNISADTTSTASTSTTTTTTTSTTTSTTATTTTTTTGGDIVIVVGNGGREHAIAVQLSKSKRIQQIICYPGNGGTALEELSTNGKIRNYDNHHESNNTTTGTDLNSIVLHLCQTVQANMVVIGPEQPLVDGLTDLLHEQCPNTYVFGPSQAAAQLEASKAFSKDFMAEYDIPTASYRNFTDVNEAIQYVTHSFDIDHNPRHRQVIKASGLAAGKGVLLPTTLQETIDAIHEIMSNKAFGTAGDTCVIESYLTGPEASCLAFCDGTTAKLMPAAQDHKRAHDNDMGLNTGGMGAYAPAPCVTPDIQAQVEQLCQRTVEKMKERGTPYVGILYAGIVLTDLGPYVLEYNCRFGDPETQILLPLLQSDLYDIMIACCTGTLHTTNVEFQSNHAATVVGAAMGYPQSYPKGMPITGLDIANAIPNVKVYHAGTIIDSSKDVTGDDPEPPIVRCNGGRVLAVTSVGPNLSSALESAYRGIKVIDFVNDTDPTSLLHYRTDIGRKAVERKIRIGVLGSTRGTALLPVIEACTNGTVHAEIVAVISNKETAPILERGRSLGPSVTTKAISSKGLSRAEFDAECTATFLGAGVDFVLLVGYMRILSKSFTDYWSGRCINVHPSLLPKHAGGMDLAVHQAVIDAREPETGCTIHYVTEAVDGGPIVVQKVVKVDASDTAETLKAKVQPLEGPAFVEAIQLYCQGTKQVISYADAGVSIDAGNRLVDMIKPYCKATRRPGCDADLGGFGGLFDLAAAGYDSSETVLIGATDGVGTKLQIAQITGKHETIGIDLVAMCVNDLLVAGGEPLFFLDYFATGHLKVDEAANVVQGIAEGCKVSGCGLIGGETAEMPSMYAPGEYDLAGFTVGAVHRDKILPQNVKAGDILLGISSSGIHSNGYSLVRKLVEKANLSYTSPCPWDSTFTTVGDALLCPTMIYVKSCLPLIRKGLVKGMAHITGGGLLENLPRSLPEGCLAEISFHPPLPPVFKWLQETSGLDDTEMLRTFNCGIGMILIIAKDNVQATKDTLAESDSDVKVFDMGMIIQGDRKVVMNVNLC